MEVIPRFRRLGSLDEYDKLWPAFLPASSQLQKLDSDHCFAFVSDLLEFWLSWI
jgi:hypothetical protein